jgi:hypothetical protein
MSLQCAKLLAIEPFKSVLAASGIEGPVELVDCART